MSTLKLTRSTRLTALASAALTAGWLAVACGNTDDVPGYDTGGTSGTANPSGGRAGANGGRAGASGGKAGANGEAGESGAADQGGNNGETGGTAGSMGGASAGFAGGGAAGMSGGAGTGGSSAGLGGGGAGGAHAGAGGAGAAGAGGGGAGGAPAGGAGAGGGGAGGAPAGGAGGTCGNGIKEGAEQCDDATAGATVSTSPKCSNTCTSISTQACVDCENAGDCFESVDNCLGVAAPFDAGQQTQCYSVISCIQKSNCFDGTGTLGKCYCGTLSTADCGAAPFTGAGSPNGACVAEIKAGFPTFNTNTQVLGGLTASNFPSGAAMKRLSCQKGANTSACLDVCGFTTGGPAFP